MDVVETEESRQAIERRTSRNMGLLTVVTGVVVTVVAAYAAHPAMPHNPVHLPGERALSVPAFLPEGWKFFTRDPQEERFYLYVNDGSGWTPPDVEANGARANFWGARRAGRAMFAELGSLTAQVDEWEWVDCKDTADACLGRVGASRVVKDPSTRPQLCGAVGVVRRKMVPFAWASSTRVPVMPLKVLRLDVQC